jgi:hypothetical protein
MARVRRPGEARVPIAPERLEELQGVGALFRFLQTYPRLRELRPGIEDEILHGALDVHIHANPCTLIGRNQDVVDVAQEAARAGMVAVCHKDHHHSTVGAATLAQRYVDDLHARGEIPTRVACYGGVPSTFTLDPRYVETAATLPACKMLWLNSVNGEVLIDGNRRVKPEAVAWIELARAHRLGITLGSPSQSKKYQGMDEYAGIMPVVEKIAELGARCVLDHPQAHFTAEEIERMTAAEGIYAGIFGYPTLPDVMKAPIVDPRATQALVERLGPARCILASDEGQLLAPSAVETMRLLVRLMLCYGLTADQVRVMVVANPRALLYLDQQEGASTRRASPSGASSRTSPRGVAAEPPHGAEHRAVGGRAQAVAGRARRGRRR